MKVSFKQGLQPSACTDQDAEIHAACVARRKHGALWIRHDHARSGKKLLGASRHSIFPGCVRYVSRTLHCKQFERTISQIYSSFVLTIFFSEAGMVSISAVNQQYIASMIADSTLVSWLFLLDRNVLSQKRSPEKVLVLLLFDHTRRRLWWLDRCWNRQDGWRSWYQRLAMGK
jgi:hypothetical protein